MTAPRPVPAAPALRGAGSVGARPVGRRRVVLTALGIAAAACAPGLTGCTDVDPRVQEPAGTTAAPTTTGGSSAPVSGAPVSGAPAATSAAASAELRLADLAAAVLAGAHRSELTGRDRRLLQTAVAVHRQHSAALQSPQPTTRPLPSGTAASRPTPLPATVTLAQSLSRLVAGERSQALLLRRYALAADGLDALLWGSMAVSAGSIAAAAATSDEPVAAPAMPKPHPVTAPLSDVAALQAMVRQLHAIVYGYQLALGRLSLATPTGRAASARLSAHRSLIDLLTRDLVTRAASVPAAAPAYVPSVRPTGAASATRLLRRMETALAPFCGLWLASMTTAGDREPALDSLAATVAAGRRWGAPIAAWPGWPG